MGASEERAWGQCPTELREAEENDEETSVVVRLLSPGPSSSAPTVTGPEGKLEDLEDSQRVTQSGIAVSVYTVTVADVVLRATAVALTLIALVLMVMSREELLKRKQRVLSPVMFYLSGYTISMNVVVSFYCTTILSFTIFHLATCDASQSSNVIFLLSIFQLDQTFAYLLISSSVNAFSCIGNLQCRNGLGFREAFCGRVLASAVVNFLLFVTIAVVSLVSGFRVVAKTRSLSPTGQLSHCAFVNDDCRETDSLAAKLLP